MARMRHYSLKVLAIAAILLMLLCVYVFRHYLPYSGIDLSPRQTPAIVISMNNVYMAGVGKCGKMWSAKAQKVEIGQNRIIAELVDIHDGKIYSDNQIVMRATAKGGVYNLFSKELMLQGSVVLTGNNGQMITGKGADWNSMTKTLRSIGRVNYISGKTNITADSLFVDMKTKRMDMQNLNMTFTVDDLKRELSEAGNAR